MNSSNFSKRCPGCVAVIPTRTTMCSACADKARARAVAMAGPKVAAQSEPADAYSKLWPLNADGTFIVPAQPESQWATNPPLAMASRNVDAYNMSMQVCPPAPKVGDRVLVSDRTGKLTAVAFAPFHFVFTEDHGTWFRIFAHEIVEVLP